MGFTCQNGCIICDAVLVHTCQCMLAGDIIKNLASGDDQAIEKAKVKADKYIQKLGGTGGDLVTVNQNKNVVNTRPAGISF